jgi:uncharacterized membrane protein YhhN
MSAQPRRPTAATLRALQFALLGLALVAVISSNAPGWFSAHRVARPLATLLTLALAALVSDPVRPRYRALMMVGIALMLVSDVIAVFPHANVRAELVCIIGAQCAWIAAFTSLAHWAERKVPFLAYALVMSPLAAAVFPALAPNFRVPVMLYIGAIGVGAAQSASWMLARNTRSARLAAEGMAWFVISNATLSIDRFRADVPYRDVIVLGTYWIALWCLARSVSRGGTDDVVGSGGVMLTSDM